MMLRPSPQEERWLTLARRLGRSPEASPFAGHTGGWRTARLFSRCAFFVLGLIAAGMIAFIVDQLLPLFRLAAAGLVCVVVAETLMLSRRHFWSGTEEALEVCGVLLLTYALLDHGFWTQTSLSARFVCVALAIVGLRLLNPLFTTLATFGLVMAFNVSSLLTGLICYGIGLAALGAGSQVFRRPSYDRMLDWLVVSMALAGYLGAAFPSTLTVAMGTPPTPPATWVAPVCALLFAMIALGVGLARRTHAPLVAFMLSAACLAYELRRLTVLPLEVRLVLGGAILLVVTIGWDRYLREPRGQITSRKLRDAEGLGGLVELAGSAALRPEATPAATSFTGGGGRYGGGGADGRY